MSVLLELREVGKHYGRNRVLKGINLDIEQGEFVVLIGGSGSGKTTLLRLVGGLERADEGVIRLRSKIVDARAEGIWQAPENRQLGMVFQDYALWPHLTCLENILAVVPDNGAHRRKEAMSLLERVGVGEMAHRRPQQLSGGQQQRVGIARALASRPDLLLFDEPLSSLDVDTREHLRMEIRTLIQAYGASALFVSHDPIDAWRLADRVVVLEGGKLTQSAEPEALYAEPATARVARFVGAHGGFRTRLYRRNGRLGIDLSGHFFPAMSIGVDEGEEGIVFVRPEGVRLQNNGLPVELEHTAFEAGRYRAYWRLPGIDNPFCSLETIQPASSSACIHIDAEHIFIYPCEGSK